MSFRFRLDRVDWNDGTQTRLPDLTVLVGPNNSGKSRALADITVQADESGERLPLVAVNVTCEQQPSAAEVLKAYPYLAPQVTPRVSEIYELTTDLTDQVREVTSHSSPQASVQYLMNINGKQGHCLPKLAQFLLAYLKTDTRLTLVQRTSSRNAALPESLLVRLYKAGPKIEDKLRQVIRKVFDVDMRLDYSALEHIEFRTGLNLDHVPDDLRDAFQFFQAQARLDEQGDGLRAFTAIVVGVLASERPVILVDEPEAFLHPPQAVEIGRFLAGHASNRQLIIATHSADVLRGILDETTELSLLRIERSGDINPVKVLSPERVKELVTDPLLNSSRVLEGLFYRGSIIVEGDADARFYRAVAAKAGSADVIHFVDAGSKQSIPRIVQLYGDMGVPRSAVVDVDVLNDSAEFAKQIGAACMSPDKVQTANHLRGEIAAAIGEIPVEVQCTQMSDALRSLCSKVDDAGAQQIDWTREIRRIMALAESTKSWNKIKRHGRQELPEHAQSKFDELAQICSDCGLFINPYGELESMLSDKGVPYTTDKRDWLRRALQLIPSLQVDNNDPLWQWFKKITDNLFARAVGVTI